MEIGLGVSGATVLNGAVFGAPFSGEIFRTTSSSTFSCGERRAQSYRSREQNQPTFVTQCSTSGFNQTSLSSSWDRFNQRDRKLGKFGHGVEGIQRAVDYGSSLVLSVKRDDDEEVVLWRTPSGESSSSPDDDQILGARESTGEASVTEEDALDLEIRIEDSGTGIDNSGQRLRQGGWRELGLGTARGAKPSSTIPKAFLLNKPRRSRESAPAIKLGAFGTSNETDQSKLNAELEKVTTSSSSTDEEAYLKDSLFKTLSSPLNGTPRTSAVDKYFGEELREKSGVSTKDDSLEEQAAADGWTDMPRSPAVSEGGERLKINLDLDLYRARTLRQKGRMIEAEAILRTCIRNWPDDGRPYVALGRLLLKQKKVQEARATYEMGCQAVRGENPYIWQAWAVLEERSGNIARARKLFDAATVADKKHAAGWHGWAKLELRAGNVKRASSLLNKGLKFCGPNEYLFQTLALIESRAGRLEEARSLLARATQHNPKSAASWLAWALMESQNGLQDTARRLFQKGIVASPKNRYVWQAWALFEARQGNKDRARELFQRGHELNPRDAVLLQAFALFEYQCGRPGVARDYFRRALVCDPTHQPVWIAWGWMEWKQGNISVARELYQGAIQADSRSMDAARAFQAWGVLEDREGDTGLARELFKCALKIDSQNVPTWMSWAAMEEREGRSMRADEIRNLFLQQRTEVVDGPSWDVDLSNVLAPAIDKIRGFFKVDQQRPPVTGGEPSSQSDDSAGNENSSSEGRRTDIGLDSFSADEDFNVDLFLREKFPRMYGSRELFKPTAILEAIDSSLKKQSRDTGRDERLDIFKNKEGSRSWK
ncbi:hypothetical protein R1flu_016480 [Riccia fluitans]|uniref:PsbB mRNA maturation factor Mbb1 n=1 Tax=Riccia fluitans TaxID=41844 RepID=A0ABD1YQ36_9MARC